MPIVIEIVMMSVAAAMLLVTKVNVNDVPKTPTLRAGVVAVIGIFGLAWLGDSFIAANKDVIVSAIGQQADAHPWTFAFGLFFASVLLYSQAATTRALMPLGMALGIPPQFLIAMFPSVNGYFFIPTYGSLIAAINFDLSGTTKIGKYVLNHSFMIPGVVATGSGGDHRTVPRADHVLNTRGDPAPGNLRALVPMDIGPQFVIGKARPMATNMPPQTRLKLLPTRSSTGRMRWASRASRYSTTISIAAKVAAMMMNWSSKSRRASMNWGRNAP